MRRTFFMVAAAVLAALPPAVAGAGPGRHAPSAATAQAAAAPFDPLGGSKLTFPLPDAPGPATLAPGARSLVAAAAPGSLLDLIVTLDRPADRRMAGALARLGVWSHTFDQLPSAAIRLPITRLTDLENLPGVLGVYDNHPLQYFLKESAQLNNTGHAWNDLHVTGKGVTVAILDTGVDFTHPDLAPAMKANVKLVGLGQDPLPTVPVADIPYAAAPWVVPVAAGTKTGKVTDFSSGGIEADTVGMNFAKNEVAGETRRPLNMGLYHPAVTTTGENVVSTRANNTVVPLTGAPE